MVGFDSMVFDSFRQVLDWTWSCVRSPTPRRLRRLESVLREFGGVRDYTPDTTGWALGSARTAENLTVTLSAVHTVRDAVGIVSERRTYEQTGWAHKAVRATQGAIFVVSSVVKRSKPSDSHCYDLLGPGPRFHAGYELVHEVYWHATPVDGWDDAWRTEDVRNLAEAVWLEPADLVVWYAFADALTEAGCSHEDRLEALVDRNPAHHTRANALLLHALGVYATR